MTASSGDGEAFSGRDKAAGDLEDAAAEVMAFIEECSETRWRQISSSEGWTVAALAYHCAVGNDVALGWICQILAGRRVYETADTHHAFNLADSKRYAGVTRDEVVDALRRTTDRTAQFLRSLTAEELERSAFLGVADREATVGGFIPNFSRHMRTHLESMRESVAI